MSTVELPGTSLSDLQASTHPLLFSDLLMETIHSSWYIASASQVQGPSYIWRPHSSTD